MVEVVELPQIVKGSKDAKWRINHPEDTGLDDITHHVAYGARFPADLVTQEEVKRRVRNIVYGLEMDTKTIEQRQQTLQWYQENPEVRSVVQNQRFFISHEAGHNERDKTIDAIKADATSFIDYVHALSAAMGETKGTVMDEFNQKLKQLEKGNAAELEKLVNDSKKPRDIRMRVSVTSHSTNEPYSSLEPRFKNGKLQVRLEGSKDIIYESDNPKAYPGSVIFDTLCKEDVVPSKYSPSIVRINYNDRNYMAEAAAKVSVKRAELKIGKTIIKSLKNILSGKRLEAVYEIVQKDFKVPESKVFASLDTRYAREDMELYLRNSVSRDVFGKRMARYKEHMYDLVEPITELRYLESVANLHDIIREDERNIPLVTPKIAPIEERVTDITNMHDPNLTLRTEEAVVPNDVYADTNTNIFLITGPNGNGKTTYENGIVNSQAFFQAGWNVFASSARMSPKDRIITHYVRPGDLTVGESRFEFELTRVGEVFDEVTPNSLVILDELYTGTKPIDGETESRGVIRQLHRSGATTYFSTHYHNLASEVESLPHAKNLMCASEQNNGHLEYTYNIVHGYTDKSEGRYLAKAKGMDEDGLARRLDTRAREGEITLRE